MAMQTERQSAIPQSRRIGIQKNCGSLRRRGIAKTFGIKGLPSDRTAKPLSQRTSSVPALLNATNDSSAPSGIHVANDAETHSTRFKKAGAIPDGAERMVSPDTSCLTQQQGIALQDVNDLHHRVARSVPPEHPLVSEEFTAPQMQRIFRTAYRITRNREDAEDAIQDAFLQAIVHLDDFDRRSKFSTWLTRIAINSSLMILRKQRNPRITSLNNTGDFEESKEFPEVRDPAPDAEERYLQKERETALHNEIHALRPNLKRVMELWQLGECSLREVADTLGLSVSAVKARLFHARRTLRNSRRLLPFRNDQPANRQDACKRSL